jgi:acyl-CoA synthetase (AMP-forming)/AMP-acid ligase II
MAMRMSEPAFDHFPSMAGKIITRGPHVMPGYWNKPEETAQALRYLRERRHLWPVCPLALPSHRQRFDPDRTLVVG